MSEPSAPNAPDAAALDWALRMADPDADWAGFTRWLEFDPGNAARYDRMVAALADATVLVERVATVTPLPANDPAPDLVSKPSPRRTDRRRWLGGALAAALVGAVALTFGIERAQPYTVATAPGTQRTVALADGSSLVLSGGTRVRLDRAVPRSATVEAGQVLFRVVHDDTAPFLVHARGLELTDLGTVFDVEVGDTRARVAVAEGAVQVDTADTTLRLDPGHAAVSDAAGLRREPAAVADIGAWQQGRLMFTGATLAEVAETLTRQLGRPIAVAPAVARRPFNGTIETRDLAGQPGLLGELLGVRVRVADGRWMLEPAR